MRNACRLTVAPTGTISMIAGCSSGIEPLFALSYHKHNILGGESLIYVDEQFEQAAREGGFYSDDLMEFLASGGSLQERADVPGLAKQLFVTAADISPEMHVRMQAAFQDSVDAAISKTINFPNGATKNEVERAYLLAWELGCKGITVYRAGSREAEVLTAGQEQGAADTANSTDEQPDAGHGHVGREAAALGHQGHHGEGAHRSRQHVRDHQLRRATRSLLRCSSPLGRPGAATRPSWREYPG